MLTNLIRSPDFVDYMLSGRFEQPLPFMHHDRKILVQLISFESRRQILVTHDVTQSEKTAIIHGHVHSPIQSRGEVDEEIQQEFLKHQQ